MKRAFDLQPLAYQAIRQAGDTFCSEKEPPRQECQIQYKRKEAERKNFFPFSAFPLPLPPPFYWRSRRDLRSSSQAWRETKVKIALLPRGQKCNGSKQGSGGGGKDDASFGLVSPKRSVTKGETSLFFDN